MAVIAGDRCAARFGTVIPVVQSVDAPAPLLLGLTNWDSAPVNLQSLGVVTQLAVTQSVAAQFQPTLGGIIFVTPFGDAPGAAELTFLTNRRCGELTPPAGESFLNYYKNWRLQPGVESTKYPAIVAIGSVTFRAFITGMTFGASSQQSVITQGKLSLTLWLGSVPNVPQYGGTLEWGWLS